MSKYRITVLMDLYEDEPEPSYDRISEEIHSALDEYGEIKEIKHEDEYCIRKNDALNRIISQYHPAT